jgi:hypothetical protein
LRRRKEQPKELPEVHITEIDRKDTAPRKELPTPKKRNKQNEAFLTIPGPPRGT